MARKKAISKAVQSLVRSNDAKAIRDALAQARAELARLQKENEGLKQKIKSLSSASAKQRQTIKSQKGQISAAKEKVTALKSALGKANIRYRKQRAKTQLVSKELAEAKQAFIKKPTLSKEQVFELYRQVDYNQFWARIESVMDFSGQQNQERLAEMKAHMAQMSSADIRDLIKIAGLRSTWYDSDAQWNENEVTQYDINGLYNMIMSY